MKNHLQSLLFDVNFSQAHIWANGEKKIPNILHKALTHARWHFHVHSFLQCRLKQHALSYCIEYNQSLLQAGKKFPVAINRVPICLSSIRTRRFFFEWRCAKYRILDHHEKVKKKLTLPRIYQHIWLMLHYKGKDRKEFKWPNHMAWSLVSLSHNKNKLKFDNV